MASPTSCIEKQIQEFLNRGGRIQRIPYGVMTGLPKRAILPRDEDRAKKAYLRSLRGLGEPPTLTDRTYFKPGSK